ncbi:hypothetical protein HPB51_008803 [Rhipicephalus microplus]|uniref:Uncharacterized protein n=1 Tax=Rhipicephalus microplus TaxID=6941 RepID=A0A9J6EZW2_RHIMP|nr:hypothetical protein HPB51_008803 [Rhipicephalus microplus]
MTGSANEVTVRLSMNEGVSDLVRRLDATNTNTICELVLTNCFVSRPALLCAQIGRCVRLRGLRCVACPLQPSQLLQLMLKHLRHLQYIELSLVEDLKEVVDSQISNASTATSSSSGSLLTFCPDLTELHVHLVWGDFSNALSQCRHLHDDVVTLGTFVFTSEVSVPIPYQPVPSSEFTNCATLCANVRHQKRPEDSWSCVELDHIPHGGLPSQVAVVAVITDSIGESFCLASHRKYWTNVRELCLLLLPLAPSSMFYPIVDAAYHDILRQFFSVALEHVVELNLTSFHFHPDLDLVALLPEGTLKTLRAFSAPPCVFPSQSAVRRLLTVCSDLRELDVRIDRRGGQLRCVACEPIRHNKIVEAAPDDATSVVRSGVARLTVCDVPAHVQLWFLECCQAAVKVRLIEWPVITKKQSYGYLRAGLRGNSAIHCLVLQHKELVNCRPLWALRILRKADPTALKHHTVIWFPAHFGQVPGALFNLNEIAHDAAHALTDHTATVQPRLAGDTCPSRGHTATLAHMFWECRTTPPDSTSSKWERSLTSSLLSDQQWAVQQAHEAAARYSLSVPTWETTATR